MTRTLLAVFILSLAVTVQAPAQDADSSARGVARLSLLAGDVSVRRGDSGEWVAGAINAPLLGEDQVLTGANSRAEVQLDYANFARLSADTELRLADIENGKYLVRLARGTMTFRVLRSTEGQAEISTPSIAIRPLKKGIYRISVLDDGSTEVTVRNGEAEIYTPRGSERLKSGRTLMARGSSENPEFQFVKAGLLDDWDRWSESRDRQLENSNSYDYVSQDISGAEDLDSYGRWENTPDYGNVWVPAATADWAPYRNGRWSWVDYYGWNWISYDPWGWAPYHYGRWINRPNYGWCWWPGRMNTRHYWSPGLVAFFGWGSGYGGGLSVGVGFGGGFGNYGWVPLAPFETYYPWYGRGYYGGYRNGRYNNVTIINNTNITNIYRNARVNNGITSVHAGDFGRGSVSNVRVNRNDMDRASVMRGQLPLVPDASSTRISDRESRVSATRGVTRGADNFYSTRQPSRVDRVPFETQRSAIQDASRRSFGETAAGNTGRRGGTVAGADGGGRGGSEAFTGRVTGADRTDTRAGDNGSSRAAQTTDRSGGRGASTDTGATTRGSDTGSWRRFGDSTSGAAPTDRSGGRGASGDRGTSSRGSDTGSWRRFGDSSSSSVPTDNSGGRGASVDRGTSTRGSDTGSWRRFGDSTSGTAPTDRSSGRGASVDRGTSTRGSDAGSWRRMSESPSTIDRSGGRVDSGSFGRGAIDRGSIDRGNSGVGRQSIDSGSFGGGRGSGSFGSAPRTSAPPVVRERSTPSFGNRSGGGGFGGRSESRQSAPQMSAPRMERSAPSGNMGGGRGGGNSGGGSRSEGRGGGGRGR